MTQPPTTMPVIDPIFLIKSRKLCAHVSRPASNCVSAMCDQIVKMFGLIEEHVPMRVYYSSHEMTNFPPALFGCLALQKRILMQETPK